MIAIFSIPSSNLLLIKQFWQKNTREINLMKMKMRKQFKFPRRFRFFILVLFLPYSAGFIIPVEPIASIP